MKKSKFSESQIVNILKQAELGQKVNDICREHGISPATYYQWKSKYGGMKASDLKRIPDTVVIQSNGNMDHRKVDE